MHGVVHCSCVSADDWPTTGFDPTNAHTSTRSFLSLRLSCLQSAKVALKRLACSTPRGVGLALGGRGAAEARVHMRCGAASRRVRVGAAERIDLKTFFLVSTHLSIRVAGRRPWPCRRLFSTHVAHISITSTLARLEQ